MVYGYLYHLGIYIHICANLNVNISYQRQPRNISTGKCNLHIFTLRIQPMGTTLQQLEVAGKILCRRAPKSTSLKVTTRLSVPDPLGRRPIFPTASTAARKVELASGNVQTYSIL